MIKKISFLFCISVLIICLDQLTKTYVQTHYALHETVSIMNNWINVTYARNFGAAFGFLDQSDPFFRDIFMLSIPPIACMIILIFIYFIKFETDSINSALINKNNTLQLTSLSSIFGGAISNYIDRLNYGYVIDFIDFHWKIKYSFPTFNIADCAIVTGALLLIVSIFKEKKYVSHH